MSAFRGALSPAREQVLALVSGLPAAKRGPRLLCMLQAFFDDSTQDGQVLVMAGFISTVDRWLRFADEWQALLDEDGTRRFKMNKMARTRKGRERSRAYFDVANRHTIAGVACAIPIEPLGRLVDELDLPSDYGNPYYIAWRALVSICFVHMKILDPIEFIFDSQTEKYTVLRTWDEYIRTAPRSIRKRMPQPPAFKNDEITLELQAADMVAWWGRRSLLEGRVGQGFVFPPEWSTDQRMFFYHIPEGGLREQFEKDIKLMRDRLNGFSMSAKFIMTSLRGPEDEK